MSRAYYFDIQFKTPILPATTDEIPEKLAHLLASQIALQQTHTFEPQGETIFYQLQKPRGHISLHTYPEYNALSCDIVLTAQTIPIKRITNYLQSLPMIKHISIQSFNPAGHSVPL